MRFRGKTLLARRVFPRKRISIEITDREWQRPCRQIPATS
jgi:hypothetical protein